ncbi:ROK family transcriptional regulator [Streptomyces sp. NBC_01244]|uniref:ROK family transcriptional regulator n=1 Tax=Streptomyces sp. NBC_01244 TaxID=2903797 RepID=UPI002E11419B|nr:ROK family transcriptional regulator [Streptomyces sp. NBC_01244]
MTDVAVMTALRQSGSTALRVADLMAATNLSHPSVTRALAELDRSGFLTRKTQPKVGRQAGRPAGRVRFRASAGHVAGIDVGSHKILVVLADLAGKVVGVRRAMVPPSHTGSRLAGLVHETLSLALRDASLTTDALWAACAGSPGIIDGRSGCIRLAPGVPGRAGTALGAALRASLPCPILLENDITLAVLAETRGPEPEPVENLLLVQWGERIGSGIIINGKPYRGASGAAGELGFIDVTGDRAGEPVSSRGLGPFEQAAGAEAIRRLADTSYRQAGASSPCRPGDDDRDLTPLFDAATAGDPIAMDVVDQVAATFAHGLATLLVLLDPGLVLLGGGISGAGEVLLSSIRRHLAGRTLTPVRLRASTQGEQGVAMGAMHLALDSAEKRLVAELTRPHRHQ